MARRLRWSIWAIVVLAHAGMLLWLAQAMRPPDRATADETVTWVEWVEAPAAPLSDVVPEPEPEFEREPERADAEPRVRRPVVSPRASTPMQAVIEPRADAPPAIDPHREFVPPERDPFSRPVDPDAARFGRRDLPSLPEASRPRIAGERPPDAPLQGLRHRQIGTKEVLEAIGALTGGGPNAPVEAPCGGRMSGGDFTAESFSPLWQQRHGCGDKKQGAGFDGSFDQPPGTVGSR